jgi:hypothetical protein
MATFSVDPNHYAATGGVIPWPTPSPLTSFGLLQDGLNAVKNTAGSSHQLDVAAGSFSIRNYSVAKTVTQTINAKKVKVQTGWTLATNGATTLGRFGAKGLGIIGSTNALQDPTTVITGLTRIYTGQSDRGYGIPKDWTLKNLILRFNGGSGYILQAGETTVDTTTEIDNLTFTNVVFEGTHLGAVGGNGSLPWGIYLDIRSGRPGGVPDYLGLKLDGVKVTLTGQGLGVGKFTPANLPMTGGSAFLSTQGDTISILNSLFDESGYRNAITIANSTNVLVSNNTFTRSSFYGNRYTGEKFVNVGGVVTTNKFEHGSYLDLYEVNRSLAITGNVFDLSSCGGYAILLRDVSNLNYALTASVNLDLSGNEFRGGLVARSEIAAPSQVVLRSSTGANNTIVVASGTYAFDRFLVGGLASDALGVDGTTEKDWISGDVGNDTLTGGGGGDAFVFATAPSSANIDSITDFTPGTDKIWLASSVFTGLTAGTLAATDFGVTAATGTDVVYDTTTQGLYFAAGGGSGLAGYTQFATLNGTSVTTLSNSDFVVF